mgnify:CR=1 FL=1
MEQRDLVDLAGLELQRLRTARVQRDAAALFFVHAADVDEDIDSSPEGHGLSAIAHGFALLHGTDDHGKIAAWREYFDPEDVNRQLRKPRDG